LSVKLFLWISGEGIEIVLGGFLCLCFRRSSVTNLQSFVFWLKL